MDLCEGLVGVSGLVCALLVIIRKNDLRFLKKIRARCTHFLVASVQFPLSNPADVPVDVLVDVLVEENWKIDKSKRKS